MTQPRAAAAAAAAVVAVEEQNGLLQRQAPAALPRGLGGQMKREWSFGKVSHIFLFFVMLGCGVLLGVVVSLHVMGYFQGNVLTVEQQLRCSGRSSPLSFILPSNPTQSWLSTSGLYHSMEDAELLWRASVVPQRPGLPIERTPKIAFMFLTKGPLPLAPLWERFFKGHKDLYSIYVHASPGFLLEVPSSSVFYGRQIPSQEIRWGEISMVDAERRLLANALLDFSNERFILLSESCIPVYNFTFIYDTILNSEVSFVAAFDDSGPFGRGRWSPGMEPEVTVEAWRKGAQWFEVQRKHAVHIVSDVKYYPKFREFCVPNCYVDEHYIPTLLSLEFDGEISHNSITFVDWSRGGAHPATFNAYDVNDYLIQKIHDDRNCVLHGQPGQICCFFARKFSPNTLDPLMKLASSMLGID